ncbi:MAG TPA: hypothetical protein VJX23_11445 [Candidatus Binataceae bacterium]|nr:hypothetical protein [Candidatus Binataceae bacterium]
MKVARLIPRLLLGLIFFVFGLNGFLHFLPTPPMKGGALDFVIALVNTHYMFPILFIVQVLGGVLLLAGVFVPFALVLLAPVIINIFFFHLMLAPDGLPLAIIVAALELFLAGQYRESLGALFSR